MKGAPVTNFKEIKRMQPQTATQSKKIILHRIRVVIRYQSLISVEIGKLKIQHEQLTETYLISIAEVFKT